MKKCSIVLGALLASSSVFALSPYDCMTGVTNHTTSTTSPGFLFADGANTIASPGAGMQWSITSVDWGMFFVGAQSYAAGQLQCRITVFAGFNPSVDPVMSAPLGTITTNFAAISSTGNAAFNVTGPTLSTPILLPVGATSFGWSEAYFDANTGARIGTVRASFTTTVLPTVGTSPAGFYRDNNDNGIIEISDFRVFNSANPSDNMVIRFNGTPVPVPEPATMVALGLGIAAVAARRRKKA